MIKLIKFIISFLRSLIWNELISLSSYSSRSWSISFIFILLFIFQIINTNNRLCFFLRLPRSHTISKTLIYLLIIFLKSRFICHFLFCHFVTILHILHIDLINCVLSWILRIIIELYLVLISIILIVSSLLNYIFPLILILIEHL